MCNYCWMIQKSGKKPPGIVLKPPCLVNNGINYHINWRTPDFLSINSITKFYEKEKPLISSWEVSIYIFISFVSFQTFPNPQPTEHTSSPSLRLWTYTVCNVHEDICRHPIQLRQRPGSNRCTTGTVAPLLRCCWLKRWWVGWPQGMKHINQTTANLRQWVFRTCKFIWKKNEHTPYLNENSSQNT